MSAQDDFGDLIANEEAEAAQEEGSHLRSAYQRASRCTAESCLHSHSGCWINAWGKVGF